MAAASIRLEGAGPPIEGLSWTFDRSARIGRDQNLDIVLADATVARHHAEIRSSPRGWMVHSLDGSSSTFVNGIRVDGAGRQLQSDDLLQCGRIGLMVREARTGQAMAPVHNPPADIKTTGAFMRIQACSRLSWEEGLREQSFDRAPAHAKHFLALVRAGYHLSRIDAVDELLQSLLDDIVVVLDAQRGAILLADEETGLLRPKTIAGPAASGSGRNFSKTLAERCFRKGDSLLCANAGIDHQTSGVHDSMVSILCGLLRSPRRRLGVLHLDRGPMQQPFTDSDLALVDALAATAAVGIESALAMDRTRRGFMQETAALLLQAIRLRDPATAEHCERVRAMAERLAAELSLSLPDKTLLSAAALLHDLGALAFDGIVKNGMQSPAERAAAHAQVLDTLSGTTPCSALEPVWPIVRHCHERWDGTGSPQGLKGPDIPTLARIIAVANFVDEMLASPTTKPCVGNDALARRLAEESQRALDPALVAAAIRIAGDLQTARAAGHADAAVHGDAASFQTPELARDASTGSR